MYIAKLLLFLEKIVGLLYWGITVLLLLLNLPQLLFETKNNLKKSVLREAEKDIKQFEETFFLSLLLVFLLFYLSFPFLCFLLSFSHSRTSHYLFRACLFHYNMLSKIYFSIPSNLISSSVVVVVAATFELNFCLSRTPPLNAAADFMSRFLALCVPTQWSTFRMKLEIKIPIVIIHLEEGFSKMLILGCVYLNLK